MKGPRSSRLRLQHILECCQRAQQLVAPLTFDEYTQHESIPLACQKLIEIIGEAANKVPAEWLGQMPAVPWPKVIGLRHRIVHDYDDIDDETLWQIIHYDLPTLQQEVSRLLTTLPE